MAVEVYSRFAVITNNDDELTDACGNCKREYKRQMLEEVKDIWQRVEPGGVMPSGQCPDPNCGALCYPLEVFKGPVKEWLQESAWIYPKQEKQFIELLTKNLKDYFGDACAVWQNGFEKNSEYPQYLCSADLRGIGGDTCHMWRDGQSWWPLSGDYSLKDEEMAELILRKSILEFLGRR
jgi:hypothetical protein